MNQGLYEPCLLVNVRRQVLSVLQKEQIAQRFMLPERQAKVNLLIKAMEQAAGDLDGEQQVYCICRTSDCDRFMM